jgi:S-adenosylmethionine hydrolase
MVLVGEIVHVDRFGNLISNLTSHHVQEVRDVTKRPNALIRIAGHKIETFAGSYSEGTAEQPTALINSDGRLEIFLKEASAADLLKVGRRARVEIS